MSNENPQVATNVLVPIDGTADTPSIRFGGTLTGTGGTGLHGDFTGVSTTVAGTDRTLVDATGLTVTGAVVASGSVTAAGISMSSGNISLGSNVLLMKGAGVPVDGTTGDNIASTGSLYIDTTGAKVYIQTSLITTPVWVLVGPV